jgi:hypothetical protein
LLKVSAWLVRVSVTVGDFRWNYPEEEVKEWNIYQYKIKLVNYL